jgi:hypothetical protein
VGFAPSALTRALVLALGLAACTPRAPDRTPTPASDAYEPHGPLPGSTAIAFRVSGGAFLDRPFPTELDRDASGKLALGDVPGRSGRLVGGWVSAIEDDRDGFSIAQTVYFRGVGPLGEPPSDARATLGPSSPIVLMDVDPQSPDRGARVPIEARKYATATAYLPAGTLAVKPLAGFVLRPGTLYAIAIRRSYGGGEPLGTTDELEAIKATTPRPDPIVERARQAFAPAFVELARRGVPRADLAAIAVFRTGHPEARTAKLVASLDRLPKGAEPELVEAFVEPKLRPDQTFTVVRGTYCTPSFQRDLGAAPFLDRGGELVVDAAGVPVPVPVEGGGPCTGRLAARFVLTYPATATRPVPLVVSAHGTGGDAATFLGEADFSGWAAKAGAAVVATDQPLHGARPGAGKPVSLPLGPIRVPISGMRAEMLFYNPFRPAATVANLAQATADAGMLARLFAGLDLARATRRDGRPVLASPAALPPITDRVMLAGHSQGSQSLVALGAFDPRIRAVLLSGSGGDLRHGVLENREFAGVKTLLEPLLGIGPGELDRFHPLLTIVQMLADPADPQTYARYYREPPAGRGPTSVLHLEGLRDSYNPEAAAEALAAALGARPISPLAKAFPALAILGLDAVATVRGNAVGGRATIAFAQLVPTHGEDGHFVMYREAAGARLVTRFFTSALGEDAPAIAGPME